MHPNDIPDVNVLPLLYLEHLVGTIEYARGLLVHFPIIFVEFLVTVKRGRKASKEAHEK